MNEYRRDVDYIDSKNQDGLVYENDLFVLYSYI